MYSKTAKIFLKVLQ